MSYDDYISREPDPWPEGRMEPEPAILHCRDCGSEIHTHPITTGIASGVSCEGCFAERRKLDAVFDCRSLPQIQADQKVSAA